MAAPFSSENMPLHSWTQSSDEGVVTELAATKRMIDEAIASMDEDTIICAWGQALRGRIPDLDLDMVLLHTPMGSTTKFGTLGF